VALVSPRARIRELSSSSPGNRRCPSPARPCPQVVYVSLPAVGTKFKKGDVIAGVESVKAASDVYAPVSGTVTEANKAVADAPAMVNTGAETTAWFVKLAVSDAKELSAMMDKAAYDKHVAASKH
jgi:glycine cleavage system H protein